MAPLLAAALVSGGTALAKGIFGAIQGASGARKQKDLWRNRPVLSMSEGEKANDALYGQLAGQNELPGQQMWEDKLGQTYAEGVSNAQQTATSSLGATQSAVDLAGKKMTVDWGLVY